MPISLTGSTQAADRRQIRAPLHFRRIELKYIIPERRVAELNDRLSPYVERDPFLVRRGTSSYPVTSLYFDSFDLHSLFAKEAGWLSRRRIRLRNYGTEFAPGSTAFFEIKRRHDFLVSKDRFPVGLSEGVLDLRAPRFLRRLLDVARDANAADVNEAMVLDGWYSLQPTAVVGYNRIAYVGRTDPDLRITFDRELAGSWRPPQLTGDLRLRSCGIHPTAPRLMAYGAHQSRGPNVLRANEYVILELKFSHGIPAWLHDIIRSMQLSRSAYSKYAFVVRDLKPNLFEAHED